MNYGLSHGGKRIGRMDAYQGENYKIQYGYYQYQANDIKDNPNSHHISNLNFPAAENNCVWRRCNGQKKCA